MKCIDITLSDSEGLRAMRRDVTDGEAGAFGQDTAFVLSFYPENEQLSRAGGLSRWETIARSLEYVANFVRENGTTLLNSDYDFAVVDVEGGRLAMKCGDEIRQFFLNER